MAKRNIKKFVIKGKNVRFNDDSYDLVKVFCDERGYKLGLFCEIAALYRMKEESKKL